MRENQNFDTIIVGGGASGLAAGVFLSQRGQKILLLEKLSRCGKKLSASGNGRGNLSNENMDAKYYRGDGGFIKGVLDKFTPADLRGFINSLGGDTVLGENGRYYISGLQASSATDLLRFKLSPACVMTDSGVLSIVKNTRFEVRTKEYTFYSNSVIIACGGMAAGHLGGCGDGYKFAEAFGHTVLPLVPSLVQLKTDTAHIRGLKGIKTDCRASAYSNGLPLKTAEGEVLFTDYGVSGNAVFALSSYLTGKEDTIISLEFLPYTDKNRLKELFKNKIKSMPQLTCEYLFAGLLGNRIAAAVLRRLGVDLNAKIGSLTDKRLDEIAELTKSFTLKVTGSLGFDSAQVTKGGVKTQEIDGETMMSKKVRGLYFTGEVIDVDGDCGGYNLHWAFATAAVASAAITAENNNG